MADNNMKVQATVELPSAKKVNEQIRALEKSISKLKISGKFDETALKNLTKQLTALKTTGSTDSFSSSALKNLTELEKSLQSEAKLTSDTSITAIEKLKKAFEKFDGPKKVNSLLNTLLQQIKKMPKEVYKIDTAMTSLYKVTDETSSKYQQFLDSASDSAQKLGRSISSLVEQTANWAKLGFDLDTSAKLAEISSVYANVGEIDDDTAISNLVSAMKAFNIEAANSMVIVDSLNKLGNEFATDAKSLGEGLKTSASSMAAAGNDVHQTLAILTGAGEINQNVSELSNGLQVVSMRLRGMKDELQSIGEEYEGIESITKIQEQISNLTNGSVNILKADGSFKSTYDQLKEISEIYFDLSDTGRADLTEILFGKNRADQGIAILQAFQSGEIQKAYEASVNSAGSAMKEQEKWLESLAAKTQQFNAAFQSLSSTVFDSDLLKWFVDLGTSGVQALDQIINKLGLLQTIGLSAGLFAGFKNVGSPKMFGLKIVLNIPTVC
ncbi:MAG: phage tail tape measure protein [Lachnospiraceae bacterium]|nr:phage tail tape measure protein [Lachnospiraceae bacterium]